MNKKWLILGGIAFVILIFAVALADDKNEVNSAVNQPANQEQRDNQKSNNVVLNSNQDKNNCEGELSLAFSKEALDELSKSAATKDSDAYQKVFSENRAMVLNNCTQALVMDSTFTTLQVRLTDQPSITGWIPIEWAK